MKYQAVFEVRGKNQMADDEFQDLIRRILESCHMPTRLKLLYAQSLEGIREEVYKKKKDALD